MKNPTYVRIGIGVLSVIILLLLIYFVYRYKTSHTNTGAEQGTGGTGAGGGASETHVPHVPHVPHLPPILEHFPVIQPSPDEENLETFPVIEYPDIQNPSQPIFELSSPSLDADIDTILLYLKSRRRSLDHFPWSKDEISILNDDASWIRLPNYSFYYPSGIRTTESFLIYFDQGSKEWNLRAITRYGGGNGYGNGNNISNQDIIQRNPCREKRQDLDILWQREKQTIYQIHHHHHH